MHPNQTALNPFYFVIRQHCRLIISTAEHESNDPEPRNDGGHQGGDERVSEGVVDGQHPDVGGETTPGRMRGS